MNPKKIKQKAKVAGKELSRVIGIETEIEVFKSSVWKPYRSAPVTILFDYGIDDVRQNLQFIKSHTNNTTYTIGGEKLAVGLDQSIELIEEQNREQELKDEVIDLWESIEKRFSTERKTKIR